MRNYKMKPYYISLFMFSVIGVLAAVAAVFPQEGIEIGDTHINFPTLTEVLAEEEADEPALSPEQLLALRAQEMRMQEEKEYLDFFDHNPARIRYPQTTDGKSDYFYLDDFYAALDGADTTSMRIVHYGDSQIEEDRISRVLRNRMQQQFGGIGVGLIPLYQSVQSLTIGQYTSREPERHMVFGLKQYRRSGSRMYGPMGQMSVVDSAVTVNVNPRSKQTGMLPAHYFSRVKLLTQSGNNMYASLKGRRETITPDNSRLQMTELAVPDSSTTFSLTLSGRGDVYGIMLDGLTGVQVDNIPMRGCSGTIFGGIDAAQLSTYFRETNTRLIIMQFGGNNMPYLKTENAIASYLTTLLGQVQYMQRQAPDAKILFIGPSDMTTRLQGKMQTYPWLAEFDERLAEMITSMGAAYWSMFQAMGGTGAMAQWVRSGLAGSDYIHFTRKGSDEVGDMLVNALLTGYRYYAWRNGQHAPIEKLQPDDSALKTDPAPMPAIATIQN